MAETTTTNYGWTMPDPGASANTWGSTLNATTQKVDAEVFLNQQGLVPVGAITMFAGGAAPANWLICDGSLLSTAAPYDKLFAVLGYTYGGSGASFNLPLFNGRFPVAAYGFSGLSATGGEATHSLTWGETGPHYHNVPDPQHYHTISQGANQHTHAVNQNPHAHAVHTGGHNHTYSQWSTAGGNPVGIASTSYFQESVTGTTSNVGDLGGSTDTQQPGVNIGAASSGISNTDYAPTRISTTDQQGSGSPHNNMPPYLAVHFIIRYQ